MKLISVIGLVGVIASLCLVGGCGVSDWNSNADGGADGSSSDSDGDADSDADGDADGDTDGDTDGDMDGDADGDTDGDADGDTDGDADGDTDGDADGDTDGDADTDGDSDSDSDGGTDYSCRLVDVVIAVDGSGSMREEQDAIRNTVFPAFAESLLQISDGLDNFRIATIDACPEPASFHTRGNGGQCGFVGGNVWIDSTSPNMNDEFACVGDIFLGDINCSGSNDDEQPASAAAASLEQPFLNGVNAGFLRDDALLVVIAITDEDEQPTPNMNAQQVFNRLVAVKGGDPTRMVFLGIGGGNGGCNNGAYGSADEATKLMNITSLFQAEQRGVWWDLCQGNLEDGLEAAFEVIEKACDELGPIV